SDDAKYGNLHRNLKWARSSTIGHGAPCCDFRIIDVSRRPDYDG
ncbi:MAG: L-2-amino-thiazoline-4-carboxylic acid hydrolase, partial [Clostridia bacterium]|nr:L-2-amino-thiazoline-4-carboxylic acid hydrolase [Clostridia bacterium]